MTNYLELNKEKNIRMTNLAFEHCSKDYHHSELIRELTLDNDLKKQICILNLETLYSQEEADKLVSNLINHGGPIREVTSLKIKEFIHQPDLKQYFQSQNILDSLLLAITDINPSVCRNIIDSIEKIDNIIYFETKLLKTIIEVTDSLKEFKQCKSYILNKKTFKLYWCLEAITVILARIEDKKTLNEIICTISEYNDYTIREKAAKILSCYSNIPQEIKETYYLLQNDENIYVKRHLNKL